MSKANTGADAIYDTGFTSYAPRSNVKFETDADVVLLYRQQSANPALYDNWKFKEAVLEVASRLLFPLAPWVMAQRSNTMHSKHALLFVRDLANVALGRDRSMSVYMRMNLMTEAAVLSNPIHLRGDMDKLNSYLPIQLVEELREYDNGHALANLSNTPEKMRDLVQSLYVMFGTAR
jgi:hypothetical protein